MNEPANYFCRGCCEAYQVADGEGIRCPACGSKERESLDATDSDILDMLLAVGAIRCEALDEPGLVEPTRESLKSEWIRRMMPGGTLADRSGQTLSNTPDSRVIKCSTEL